MTSAAHAPSRILLVEDRQEDAKLFQIIVREIAPHLELLTFSTGIDFLKYLQDQEGVEGPKTLVFLDVKLPEKGGLEVLKEMKSNPLWKKVPVIVFTSSAAPSDYLTAYELHANAYLQKPIEVIEFRRVLKLAVDFWLTAATLPSP